MPLKYTCGCLFSLLKTQLFRLDPVISLSVVVRHLMISITNIPRTVVSKLPIIKDITTEVAAHTQKTTYFIFRFAMHYHSIWQIWPGGFAPRTGLEQQLFINFSILITSCIIHNVSLIVPVLPDFLVYCDTSLGGTLIIIGSTPLGPNLAKYEPLPFFHCWAEHENDSGTILFYFSLLIKRPCLAQLYGTMTSAT